MSTQKTWTPTKRQLKDAANILSLLAQYDHKDAIDLSALVARTVWEKDKWKEVLVRVGRKYQWEKMPWEKKDV